MKRKPKQMVTKEVVKRVSKLMLDKKQAENLIDYIMELEPLAYKAMLDLVDAFIANTSYFLPTKDVDLLYAFIGAAFFTGYLLSRESILPLDEIERLVGKLETPGQKAKGTIEKYDSQIDELLDSGKTYKDIGDIIKKTFKDVEKKHTVKKVSSKKVVKKSTKKNVKSSKKLPKDGLDFSL